MGAVSLQLFVWGCQGRYLQIVHTSIDYCRYLAGPLPLDSKPLLQAVPCHNACEEYVYTTMACWNDMGLIQFLLQKEKKTKDYTCWRQFNEKPSIIPAAQYLCPISVQAKR